MQPKPKPQWNFHLELNDPLTTDQLIQALGLQGIKNFQARETSRNHEGVIVTQELARKIWSHTSGQATCTGDCCQTPGAPRHTRWEDLDPLQQDSFMENVALFMEVCRQDQYEIVLGFADEQFDQVALESCRTSSPPPVQNDSK